MRAARTLVLLALPLAGCAGVNHAMQYASTPIQRVPYEGDVYRIYDQPEQGRLMITPSIAASGAQGLVQGATFGIVDAAPNRPGFEPVVRHFLHQSGREECEIVDGFEIIRPQWEFQYSCREAY